MTSEMWLAILSPLILLGATFFIQSYLQRKRTSFDMLMKIEEMIHQLVREMRHEPELSDSPWTELEFEKTIRKHKNRALCVDLEVRGVARYAEYAFPKYSNVFDDLRIKQSSAYRELDEYSDLILKNAEFDQDRFVDLYSNFSAETILFTTRILNYAYHRERQLDIFGYFAECLLFVFAPKNKRSYKVIASIKKECREARRRMRSERRGSNPS